MHSTLTSQAFLKKNVFVSPDDVYRRKKSERQYQAMIADGLIDIKEPESK